MRQLYKWCMKHRMILVDDDSITDLPQSISDCSVADYICYSVHEGKRLVTVILETKKISINGVAQLLGYYFRTATSYQAIGVCLLLSKQSLCCILCLFGDQAGTLVNAICLKEIKLKDLPVVISLLAILTSSSSFCRQALTSLEEHLYHCEKSSNLSLIPRGQPWKIWSSIFTNRYKNYKKNVQS